MEQSGVDIRPCGLIAWSFFNDTYAFEPAYDTYAKLNDRGLNVAFVPVPADDGDDRPDDTRRALPG